MPMKCISFIFLKFILIIYPFYSNFIKSLLIIISIFIINIKSKFFVTDVRVRLLNDSGKLKAVASVSFDDEFVVHDLKIVEGVNGLFIAMPSRRAKDGEFKDICHPINNDMRTKIETAIYKVYNELINSQVESESTSETETTEEI